MSSSLQPTTLHANNEAKERFKSSTLIPFFWGGYNQITLLNAHIFLSVVGAALCFLPLHLHTYNYNVGLQSKRMASIESSNMKSNQVIEELLNSSFYRESAIASFSLIIAPAIDALLHITFSSKTDKILLNKKVAGLSKRERFLFIIGIAISTATVFLERKNGFGFGALFFVCSIYSMNILCGSAVLIFLGRKCNNYWTPTITSITLILLIIGSILSSLSFQYDNLRIPGNLLLVISLLLFICNVVKWAIFYFSGFTKQTSSSISDATIKKKQNEAYVPLVHMISFMLIMTVGLILPNSFTNLGTFALVLFSVFFFKEFVFAFNSFFPFLHTAIVFAFSSLFNVFFHQLL